jgi:hypothetical protein
MAQVDVSGGQFFPTVNVSSVYVGSSTQNQAMAKVDQYLHDQRAVALTLASSQGGHAVTAWGYANDQQNPTSYLGLWISDSDDDRTLTVAPDRLRHYDVQFNSTTQRWYLQDYFSTSDTWYIARVDSLVPEPATLTILLGGLAALVRRRKR